MTCTAERRREMTDAADQLCPVAQVAAVDVLAPTRGPRDEWTLEIVVGRTDVPPDVLQSMAANDLAVEDATTRGATGHTIVIAVAH